MQLKMFLPLIVTRVEQACDLACGRIDARYVGTFVVVTIKAGPGQIVGVRWAFMLFRDNVIHLERCFSK